MPEPGNPQALNCYSFVLNNPLRYTDPTGLSYCDSRYAAPEDCAEIGIVPVQTVPLPTMVFTPPQPTLTVALNNPTLSDQLAMAAALLQLGATLFSSVGAGMEVVATAGGAALGSLLPPGNPVGAGAGAEVGFAVDNAAHRAITNPPETGLSALSFLATSLADVAGGETRIEFVSDTRIDVILGEATTVSGGLALVGALIPVGVVDLTVDFAGSLYVATTPPVSRPAVFSIPDLAIRLNPTQRVEPAVYLYPFGKSR